MKNSYYLITLPVSKSKARVDEVVSLSKSVGKPRDMPQIRFNKDQTEAIFQGEISDELLSFTKSKGYITYLGDCLEDGQAEQKVHDFIQQNKSFWETD